MHRIPKQKLVTLFGLTSLVATMITIARFSSSLTGPIPGAGNRYVISHEKLIEYQQRLRLIASNNNSNETLNNLLENLMTISYNKLHVISSSSSSSSNSSDDKYNKTSSINSTNSDNNYKSAINYNIPVLKNNNYNNNNKVISLSSSSSQSLLSSIDPLSSSSSLSGLTRDQQQQQQQQPIIINGKNIGTGSHHNIPEPHNQQQQQPLSVGEANNKDNNNKPTIRPGLRKSKPVVVVVDPKADIKTNDINIDVDPQVIKKDRQQQQQQQQQQKPVNPSSADSNLQQVIENEEKVPKIPVKPKLVFDSKDLSTTEHMLIDKPLGCDDDMGASLDLLVIVNSAVDHWEAREAIRDTWGKFAIERGAYLLFLVGSSLSPVVQHRVLMEDERTSDLLQGQYIDNYFNLTLKTISMMHWLSTRCSRVKYVLKVDDDMFVNMQHITDFTETRNFNKCIIGKLAKNWKPHRNTNNKWYVPPEAFNGTVFPTFATGPAYMMSGDAVKPLYETSLRERAMYLEDVYMTGIVAEKAGIRRLNHAMFRNTHVLNLDECLFKRLMTSHKHSPEEIRRLWQLVYRQPPKDCTTPAPKTVKPVVVASVGAAAAANKVGATQKATQKPVNG
ncbi:acetylgalactosaminyl-O-glycosyl-glycoprotein beta-1,3-N-acetylglucosaminyltransferase-like [Oppia nitens]|uniref:acetylgalactosaminyl-O-glycosyl-glycoprotein beta-1,3-N-acetylglucosaminyltransferase-like n=1 Tax=Oppia nitens TaxID=1686743 RepID=UPI0023DA4AE5|nr:acetylgalactosaminyl-O-glycosyl-glycoprotein beta-1,3-N-acetylglucosaminyltransferase-like [Oppia nitens]